MTRIFTTAFLFLMTLSLQAQNGSTGSIAGKLTDKEMNGEPLPFANVLLKGTTKGATTDMNGLYEFKSLEPGKYTIVFSFVGYETIEVPNVDVVAGKVTEVNTELGSSAASLDEVVITTVSRRDSEVALLLDQKKAIEIKESIGARELAKLGVSDVATATTRISGVSSSEASGDIFVRGLGDRYLYTTLNGLPIPSDDVERKNIDLELFPTGVIRSVGISKTYTPSTSADQASGNIDISTRELVGSEELSAGIGAGVNTNVLKDGVFNNFKVSVNTKKSDFGFYTGGKASEFKLIYQDWTPGTADLPMNYKYSLTAGKRFGEKLEVLVTGSQDVSYGYTKGEFREFRANFINDSISDAEIFSKTINTTGLATVAYEFSNEHYVRGNSLFINKLADEVYEGGRNGEGYIYEETDENDNWSQFVRDQNTKQTRLWINQLLGEHQLGENNNLHWAAGFNLVNADEPNRIRNEVNFNEDEVNLGNTGGYQQRKSYQEIDDYEFNGMISDKLQITKGENRNLDVSFGGNYRFKKRDFISRFLGLEESSTGILTPSSVDNISEVFTEANLANGTLDINNSLQADRYRANLESAAGFTMFNLGLNKWNLNAGARYQQDELDVVYNVGNIPGRIGSSNMSYNNFYPALNLRYALNKKNNLRLASSKTLTLPEFKEVAPFEYVSQTGQVTRGNPDLQASTNYNFDLKWEYFPSTGELISLTAFYKKIEDPINKVQDRGSAGVFSFFNAGKQAEIYGLELESKLELISIQNGAAYDLNLGFNASRMWHSQDLKEVRDADGTFIRTFQYKGLTETGLQGASDWIFNGSLNFQTGNENPFMASLVANYASDKIFALGAPERQSESETFYNDAIVEKGFVTLNAVLSQDLGEHWSLKFTGKNLLNPKIERIQKIKPSTTGIETTETVRSYTRGAVLSLGINYSF
ncbi:Outer membrane receptor proteins, mostly Fe transport [Salinimicrobium catena]|uniref:Outer membrane receptor proteins, mostly Fe transport n=1 Tax=Salinimicrobium catena TaxID=390640 RepID=A0A1H5NV27_9FLAO|nr:TonB-dependent receptor [Salinimicrobium catena]SDL61203.1 Outer membrane receptor proteins, mostly Fe transport [Salinimicrobium catena]SEF05300.1 Outer membrane receptor proteins, mostly Fe transport [Salinimicrobium catena]